MEDVRRLESTVDGAERPRSTYQLIAEACARSPTAPALSFFLRTQDFAAPVTWTYGQLLEQIHRCANVFHALGADKDTVIAFVLPNLPETHWVIWGGEATGVVFAVNPLLESPAIGELLAAAKTEILVTLAPFPGSDLWEKVTACAASVPSLRHVVTVSLSRHVRGIPGIAARLAQRAQNLRSGGLSGLQRALPKGVQWHDFHQSMRRQNGRQLDSQRRFDADDVASYFCTGGTTGLPKIAVRTHRNEVANAWSAAQCLGAGIGPGKTIFCGLPLFHVNGVLVTGLVPFSQGAHVVLAPPQGYRAPGLIAAFWNIVEHHRINFFSGVPTLYAALLQVPTAGRNLDSLEFGLCGAAPLPVSVMREFEELTGLKILEGYGLTEGTCVSSVNPPGGERRHGSIGLRVPGQQMKAVEMDEAGHYLRDCDPGEIGALVICGPNVFQGYKIESQNTGLWLQCDDGGPWLNTGDIGRRDSEGYFYLTGRKKELIIRGGHNIDPATIEAPLHRHPAVEIAAAVGRPDAHAGELPVAYVQLKPGMQATAAELLDFLRTEISERAALPKSVEILPAMPLTAVGKIFKPALKTREIEQVLTAALRQAGIQGGSVQAADSKTQGLVAQVTIAASHLASAQAALGQFAVPFVIHTDS